jgi:hypothetical protein
VGAASRNGQSAAYLQFIETILEKKYYFPFSWRNSGHFKANGVKKILDSLIFHYFPVLSNENLNIKEKVRQMSSLGFTRAQTMKLLGRKFPFDPFLYCFGTITGTTVKNEDDDFQLILEVEGNNYVISSSPFDHFSFLVNKVVEMTNIPRHFVHLLHGGRTLNVHDHNSTLRDLGLHQEDVIHLELYVGKAGMLKRSLKQSQVTDIGLLLYWFCFFCVFLTQFFNNCCFFLQE